MQGRHPAALAHLANHPPPGTAPNVVVAAVDWAPPPEDAPELRAYFPVVDYAEGSSSSSGGSEESDGDDPPRGRGGGGGGYLGRRPRGGAVPGVALVALRDLEDEELFLNYRLNPNAPGGLPSWYSSVDPDEDERRWAR